MWAEQLIRERMIWISPSAAGSGASGFFSVLSGVSSVSTMDAEGQGCCRSGIFVGKEVDRSGDKGSEDTSLDLWRSL
jgi:hypothetical protein